MIQAARGKTGLVRKWEDNVHLSVAEFARLRPVPSDAVPGDLTYQLKDEEVNSFVAMLNRSCTGSYGFVFTSHVHTALAKENRTFSNELVERLLKAVPVEVDLLAQDQLFFVVNVPATEATLGHWFFVCVHKANAYIAAVESCSGTHPEAIAVVQRFLERLHADAAASRGLRLGGQHTEDWRSASLSPPLTPHQPDAVSCGVHMLIGIWCCMSGVTLASRLDSQSVNYWRDVLTLCLYRGGLRSYTA